MSKQVSLSDQTVTRLKRLAEPLEDTFDSVITRLLDNFEAQEEPRPATVAIELNNSGRQFDPLNPPSLTHTKLMVASVAGTPLPNPNWNGLLDALLRHGFSTFGDYDALDAISPLNLIKGRKTDEGFHFLSDVGFSVQGQDANDAWRHAVFLAQILGCDVQAQFMWRLKEGAAFPGEIGRLEFVRKTG